MHIQLIRCTSELTALLERWDRLPRPSPMQSLEWYLSWWNAYADRGHELFVVTVVDSAELIAVAPWYVKTTLSGRHLRCLGDGHACSDHATLLCQPGRQQEVVHLLAQWLVTDPSAQWHQLALESVDISDKAVTGLIEALAALGCPVTARPEVGSCHLDLPSTWDELLSSVSKNHRKRCRRWQKEFFDTGRVHVQTARDPHECSAAFETLVQLHRDRRNSLGEPGAFESLQFRAFHGEAVTRLAATGQLRLCTLYLEGKAVSAEYLLDDGEELFLYQSGLSSEGANFSAGNLSLLALLRDAIADGYKRLDFLRGIERYKLSWGATPLSAQTHVVRRGTAAGHIGAWSDAAWSQAKELKRRLVSST